MKHIRLFIFPLFIILIAVASCKKDDGIIVEPPVEMDPTYKQYGTPYSDVPTTENIVMYEINLRAFSSGGDIQGIIDRLDYLKDLGINTIWLMPIFPIGEVNSVNSPYSIRDFKAVSSEYGTLDDLRKLTDEAHTRGIAVISDWVANHTSWDNNWINKKSWYSQDANGNIIMPPGTNWADVADLDFSNEEMRLAMIDAMKYWILEANIDGYRCDYADGVPFDFWKQALDTLANIPNRSYIFLAEGNRSDHFAAGFDLNYGWDFYGTTKSVFTGQAATSLIATNTAEYNTIPNSAQKLRFTTNHDESAWDNTPMVLFNGKEGALAASVISIFMGGVPMIYTGQEVGRQSTVPFFSNTNIDWNANPDMLQAYKDILNFYAQSEVSKRGTNAVFIDNDVSCFKKVLNNEEVLIIVNVRNNQTNYQLNADLQNTDWTDFLTGNTVSLGTELLLENYQYLILEK